MQEVGSLAGLMVLKMTINPLLSVHKLNKKFGGIVVADSINIDIYPSQIHAVIGENGSGKTTLLKQIFGEISPDSGIIYLNGINITRKSIPARARAGIGRSYQITNIFKGFTLLENLLFGIFSSNIQNKWFPTFPINKNVANKQASEQLDRVGLSGKENKSANELSYGEFRQLEIAVAISSRPKVLLLDEPLAGLGFTESKKIVSIINSLKSEMAILIVEHDISTVLSLANHVSILSKGKVQLSGPTNDPIIRKIIMKN